MFSLFGYFSEYFYLVLILQAICVFHSIRRGTQAKWLWLIVVVPLVGALVYIFSEIIKKKDVQIVSNNVTQLIHPTGRIKELERKLEFSDTFSNRVALADAYLAAGQIDQAIELYESSLQGVFADNEQVIKQLILAYYEKQRYNDVIALVAKLPKNMDFEKSRSCLIYALSLEQKGDLEKAEQIYSKMNLRFSNYEARYHYGQLLNRQQRSDEAVTIYQAMLSEATRMNWSEKGKDKTWIAMAKEELAKHS